MLWLGFFFAALAVISWWIWKNPREEIWYRVFRFCTGLGMTIGADGLLILLISLIKTYDIVSPEPRLLSETDYETTAAIIFSIIADLFVLWISGKLMFQKLSSWQGFLGALGIQMISFAFLYSVLLILC